MIDRWIVPTNRFSLSFFHFWVVIISTRTKANVFVDWSYYYYFFSFVFIHFTFLAENLVMIELCKIKKEKKEITWKCKIMIQMRPSVSFGLPSTISSDLIFTILIRCLVRKSKHNWTFCSAWNRIAPLSLVY